MLRIQNPPTLWTTTTLWPHDLWVYLNNVRRFFPNHDLINQNLLPNILSVFRCVCVRGCACVCVSWASFFSPVCSRAMIRALPFLRLSLPWQKATWGMTGPTWLTLAALPSAIFIPSRRKVLTSHYQLKIINSIFFLLLLMFFFPPPSPYKGHAVLLPQTGWSWDAVGSNAG